MFLKKKYPDIIRISQLFGRPKSTDMLEILKVSHQIL